MVDKPLIQRKLTLLKEKQTELRSYKLVNYADFVTPPYPKAVEKLLQEMVEICIDIGKHIIADTGLPTAGEYREIFSILSQHKIISIKTVTVMHNMVGFRNLIIHMYERIDTHIVFGIYKKHLKDFDRFAAEIVRFIRR